MTIAMTIAMAHVLLSKLRRWVLLPLKPVYEALPLDERAAEGYDSEKFDPAGKTASRLWPLAPFFIAAPLGRTSRVLPRPSSTSYMNGLRGVACFVVYHQHLAWQSARWIQFSYGIDDANTHFWQLPLLRDIHSGLFMVAIFFVLSGFVLAYSPLKKINSSSSGSGNSSSKADAQLLVSLSSSLFRRPLRLFAPMMAAVLVTAVLIWFFPNFDAGGWTDGHPSFVQHVARMLHLVSPILNPFYWGYYWPRGFTHGWSLQLEYRGSIVVFLCCLMTAKMTPNLRKLTLVLAGAYALFWLRWEVFCFLEGMFLADLRFAPIDLPQLLGRGSSNSNSNSNSIIRPTAASAADDDDAATAALLPTIESLPPNLSTSSGPDAPASSSSSSSSQHHSLRSTILWSGVLGFGLLLGGWPTHGADVTYPWKAFYPVMPAMYATAGAVEPDPAQLYWISISAGLVLLALEFLPRAARAVFDTRAMVYLGEISYAFYLLHQPVMFSLGTAAYLRLQAAGFGASVCFWTEYFFVLFVLLCVSDWFWRGVDENVVKLSRRFAVWCGIC